MSPSKGYYELVERDGRISRTANQEHRREVHPYVKEFEDKDGGYCDPRDDNQKEDQPLKRIAFGYHYP